MTPTPIPVTTLLPDQTLASLSEHGQAITSLAGSPMGAGIIGLLALAIALLWVIPRRR
jgi:putative effector of murein hydrolase LrgA (UPF0299 family)